MITILKSGETFKDDDDSLRNRGFKIETSQPWENAYKIYVLRTAPDISQFFSDVSGMTCLDYDMAELISLIIKSLYDFNELDEEFSDLMIHYQQSTIGREGGERDWEILQNAIPKLYMAIRTQVDIFDLRDSSGLLQYRLGDYRRNDDIVLIHKDHNYTDPSADYIPKPSIDVLADKQQQLSLSDLLGADNGYSDTEYIADISKE
jgi:hypothetical protein